MIVWSEGVPSAEDYVALRAAAGLGPRSLDAARRGLPRTLHGVLGLEGARLVVMGRVVGDGGCFALLTDIAVHPDRQGAGLGREATLPPDCHLSLVSSARAVPLYAAHGFRPTRGLDRYADPHRAPPT